MDDAFRFNLLFYLIFCEEESKERRKKEIDFPLLSSRRRRRRDGYYAFPLVWWQAGFRFFRVFFSSFGFFTCFEFSSSFSWSDHDERKEGFIGFMEINKEHVLWAGRVGVHTPETNSGVCTPEHLSPMLKTVLLDIQLWVLFFVFSIFAMPASFSSLFFSFVMYCALAFVLFSIITSYTKKARRYFLSSPSPTATVEVFLSHSLSRIKRRGWRETNSVPRWCFQETERGVNEKYLCFSSCRVIKNRLRESSLSLFSFF